VRSTLRALPLTDPSCTKRAASAQSYRTPTLPSPLAGEGRVGGLFPTLRARAAQTRRVCRRSNGEHPLSVPDGKPHAKRSGQSRCRLGQQAPGALDAARIKYLMGAAAVDRLKRRAKWVALSPTACATSNSATNLSRFSSM